MPPIPPPTTATTPAATTPELFTHQRDIPVGTKVPVSLNGKQVLATFVSYDEVYSQSRVSYQGKIFRRTVHGMGSATPRAEGAALEDGIANGRTLNTNGQISYGDKMVHPDEIPSSRFDINTRFEFIEELSDMTIDGEANSLVITGSGGLGKSYTVLDRLRLKKRVNEDDVEFGKPYHYTVIKGFSTPKALYRILYLNREKLVIFDDCDSVLDDPIAVNLLKAALDSYETRWVHWMSEKGFGSQDDDDLPVRFEFKGQIIFISNRRLRQVDQAILSRCLYVDVSMTTDEKLARIGALMPKMCKEMSKDHKQECLDLLVEKRADIKDLNIRTFLKVADLRKRSKRWREVAEYVITAAL